MTGAIAGTAILNIDSPNREKLHTVTLTVNDSCNLDCSYCYLRTDSNSHYAGEEVIELLERSDFTHLAIVGKEPLVNRRDAIKTLQIIERIGKRGITASLVTNGSGLKHIDEVPQNLAYIDVSFDGTPETFKARRIMPYSELVGQIERLTSGGLPVNALQTIYGENVGEINEMMAIREIEGLGTILFSPYLATRNYGTDGISRVGLSQLLDAFAESPRFREDNNSISLIDRFHVDQEGVDFNKIREDIDRKDLDGKVRTIELDPLHYGIVRVTYDGNVLTPEQSLHIRDYAHLRSPTASTIPLEKTFEKMVA